MSFIAVRFWKLVCNGLTPVDAQCGQVWTGSVDTADDDEDPVRVEIMLDAPELVAAERTALIDDGWLICTDDGGRVLCPDCRKAAEVALLDDLAIP